MSEQGQFSDPGKPINISRVTFSLPCKRPAEIDAFMKILDHVKVLLVDKKSLIKGFTASNYPEAVFFGKWISDQRYVMQDGSVIEKGETVTDRHVLIHFDINDFGLEEEEFQLTVAELHQRIAEIYYGEGAGQFTFWVIAHRCVRFVYSEYEKAFSDLSSSFQERGSSV